MNVGRQFVVHAIPKHAGREAGDDIKVCDLCDRMYAGVGAPGSIQLEVLTAGDLAHRAIDLALNRSGVLLNLPAAVPGAGVLNRQLEAWHAPF
jgi:hypothetical protein